MKIAVSQRVVVDERTGERRDALDQRWTAFLRDAGLLSVAVPNCAGIVRPFLSDIGVAGVLLTGGNDLVSLGGTAPERDEAEAELIAYAQEFDMPLLGVCRGMQMIQVRFGVQLRPVEGHVSGRQSIEFEGTPVVVNSYHKFGSRDSVPGLAVLGRSEDGVVKAVRSERGRVLGIMWHPERMDPTRGEDTRLFRHFFAADA